MCIRKRYVSPLELPTYSEDRPPCKSVAVEIIYVMTPEWCWWWSPAPTSVDKGALVPPPQNRQKLISNLSFIQTNKLSYRCVATVRRTTVKNSGVAEWEWQELWLQRENLTKKKAQKGKIKIFYSRSIGILAPIRNTTTGIELKSFQRKNTKRAKHVASYNRFVMF